MLREIEYWGGMMRMSEHKDTEKYEQEVRLWLEKRGIPHERYMNLPTSNKVVLHDSVCPPTRPTTYAQREELYRKLCLPESRAGIKSPHPGGFTTDEGRQRLFSPLTPSEKLDYLEKF